MAVRGGSPGIPRSLLQLAAAVVIGSVLLVRESMQVVAQDCSATKHCANSLCCSQYNYCGTTAAYCGDGCLSGPCSSGSNPTPVSGSPPAGPAPGGSSGVGSIITASIFHQFFLHTNDAACPAAGTYTYSSFLTAAASFPQFGNVGNTATRRKELAAFLAHCSHETTGGWPTAPDGPYAWGLCFREEIGCPADGYCDPSSEYPCAPGKSYCGRGSLQLTWNYNYGQAGDALNLPLLAHPELVENDHVLVWKTAIWFWMTAQTPKPSAHAVITGQWTPSPADKSANRLPGFGATTNIVNGGIECGHGGDPSGQNRIGFFQRYTGILGISPGSNLDCGNQRPWG